MSLISAGDACRGAVGPMVEKRVHPGRIRILKPGPTGGGPVALWMSRDQRATDNWALIHAQGLALEQRAPLLACFCLAPSFLDAARRQYDFMIRGLMEVASALSRNNIPFFLLSGDPGETIPRFLKSKNASVLVTDFDPLRIKQKWLEMIVSRSRIPVYQVDSHNIVPCRVASDKQEYAARTIRGKIQRLLADYLTSLPKLRKHPFSVQAKISPVDWRKVQDKLKVNSSPAPVSRIIPGETAARDALITFVKSRLPEYHRQRNDPNREATSRLSPYLHFGQIAAQRVALEIESAPVEVEARSAFLEELIIRRELADNFCFYNRNYDAFDGFPEWARKTLDEHRQDRRVFIYSPEVFEQGLTHDRLWNAAQHQMMTGGSMHGYLRMYWAKKILEWSESPEEALRIAICLNDKYELDGRDPNGYAGIAWAIGGVHDRPWPERKIFGKIRYMNERGARSKFDVDRYIARHTAG